MDHVDVDGERLKQKFDRITSEPDIYLEYIGDFIETENLGGSIELTFNRTTLQINKSILDFIEAVSNVVFMSNVKVYVINNKAYRVKG